MTDGRNVEIRARFRGGVAILNVVGRLVRGSTPSLRTFVCELVANGRVAVLVHMAAVTDMDAHGIGELVSSLTTVERHGGRLALIAPSAFVRRLLALTRLDTVFTICDSEREALVSLRVVAVAAPLPRKGFDDREARPCI
ncbi:MAG TPA: STAS domain-containing protein [Vicinamibacterales bacterium]